MEGVIVSHETIHKLHKRKQNEVIFKIDFEKTHDKVKWPFVRKILQMKGFSNQWCQWIDSIIQGGHMCIKINDQVDENFQTKKVLRQGDLLSPLLFNIVVPKGKGNPR
jgi:hypothetical protein